MSDASRLPFVPRRVPVTSRRGMVATSQPIAVRAGRAMLEAGGNAVDAAVAMAAMLVVVEPTSNGIGGDAFALVWDVASDRTGTPHGYNGSGRSPAGLTIDAVRAAGHSGDAMPTRGWLSVTVPGAPRAWRDVHRRFGRLPFAQVLAPAVETAARGYAVTPVVAAAWARAERAYASNTTPAFAGWRPTFAPGGRAPRAGETWRSPDMAASLRLLADSGGEDFYTGRLAHQLVAFARETGGLITADDLATHRGDWVVPICAAYRGHDVWEIPPNGQGLAALLALRILDGIDLAATPRESVGSYHLQIEAIKLAFADVQQHVADADHCRVAPAELLSDAYVATRRAMLRLDAAGDFRHGTPARGGTVYLVAADADGTMVSYIQSNYSGFGSGIVVPGTGVALQNRGAGFSLDAGHANALAPRRRPFHTIIPAFLSRDGKPVGPFGVMGGHMQPQGHVQVVVDTLDYGLDPQAALDAPRWHWLEGRRVAVEATVDPAIVAGLRELGHQVEAVDPMDGLFGRGQIVWRTPDGGHVAGSEPRSDGMALA